MFSRFHILKVLKLTTLGVFSYLKIKDVAFKKVFKNKFDPF
ncbi:MAG: hypothetical protein ACJAYJ_004916 [Saprospiraceae bacterium]|jgi:hypothetical protein